MINYRFLCILISKLVYRRDILELCTYCTQVNSISLFFLIIKIKN